MVKAPGSRLCAGAVELSESRLALALRSEPPPQPAQLAKYVGVTKSPWRITPDQRLVRAWVGTKEREDRLRLAKSLLAELLSKAAGAKA